MAYDTSLERRIDARIADWENIDKKKMFGGVCYLARGNMSFGIWKDYLIIRTDPDTASQKLKDEFVRPFDVTGRPMKGWLMVEQRGWANDDGLTQWLVMGRTFALSLPEK